MDRKEIEEMFDIYFNLGQYHSEGYSGGKHGLRCNECDEKYSGDYCYPQECPSCMKVRIKSFFFDTILPEVLRDMIPLEINANHNDMEYGWNSSIENIKRKAKEKYNITL